jgi:hypothetical protein
MTAPNNKPMSLEEKTRFTNYYKEKGSWGNLHIVLDDKNVKDKHVAACMEFAEKSGDEEGYNLADILRTMSKSQRLKLANTDFSGARRF